MHDPNKVLMGVPMKSFRVSESVAGNAAAGTAVRLKSDGSAGVALADGELNGVSLGSKLCGPGFISIALSGNEVPLLLTASFEPVIGDQVIISDTTGLAAATGTAVNAIYASTAKTAILEDGTEVAGGCALIKFVGGL